MSDSQLTWTIYESPLGPLTVIGGPAGVRNVHFPGRSPRLKEDAQRPVPEVVDQLEAYFSGERKAFELDLDLRGAPLQKLVWEKLREIPYGATTSYGDLAGRIEESLFPAGLEPYKRVRLVGTAIGRTPTPILVPCHRVIGADGSLTGYGGGLQRKQALLELESAGAGGSAPAPRWENRQLTIHRRSRDPRPRGETTSLMFTAGRSRADAEHATRRAPRARCGSYGSGGRGKEPCRRTGRSRQGAKPAQRAEQSGTGPGPNRVA